MITFIFIAGVRSVILLCCKKETIMSETGDVQVYVVKLRAPVCFPFLFLVVFGFIHFIEHFDDFSSLGF